MLAEELLKILVCPETKQPLALANPDLLLRLNGSAEAGTLVNRGGKKIAAPLEAALVREDGKVAYAIRNGIPVLLVDEGFSPGA